MSDVVDLDKKRKIKESNTTSDPLVRIRNCRTLGDECTCAYCRYSNKTKTVMYDFLCRDADLAQRNIGINITSFDLKMIAYGVIEKIEEYEREAEAKRNGEEDK